jgi:DNA-binding transcriptional MocR family regulator
MPFLSPRVWRPGGTEPEGNGVAALPGESVGLAPTPGRQVLRLSYGMLDAQELAEALARLFQGLNELAGG